MQSSFETRIVVDRPSQFETVILDAQGTKSADLCNLKPEWNPRTESYELFFFE